jgi:hypothetical protein
MWSYMSLISSYQGKMRTASPCEQSTADHTTALSLWNFLSTSRLFPVRGDFLG